MPDSPISYEVLKDIYTMAVYGDIGTGKTAISYKIIELFKPKMKVYFIKHPKPQLIEKLGYENMQSLEQMENIEDSFIYADEPQLWTSIYDKKSNAIIAKMCSLARQKNNKLLMSSSDTRVFGRHNESYFDAWIIKDLDYNFIKNGSVIKHAFKDVAVLDPAGIRLPMDAFVFWSRKLYQYKGKYTFKKPINFTDEHSKPYKMNSGS